MHGEPEVEDPDGRGDRVGKGLPQHAAARPPGRTTGFSEACWRTSEQRRNQDDHARRARAPRRTRSRPALAITKAMKKPFRTHLPEQLHRRSPSPAAAARRAGSCRSAGRRSAAAPIPAIQIPSTISRLGAGGPGDRDRGHHPDHGQRDAQADQVAEQTAPARRPRSVESSRSPRAVSPLSVIPPTSTTVEVAARRGRSSTVPRWRVMNGTAARLKTRPAMNAPDAAGRSREPRSPRPPGSPGCR